MTRAQASAQPRILIVDDDRQIRLAVSEVLVAAGYEVHSVDGGRAAISRLAQGDIDAVLSDIRMPELDGVELLREIHARDPRLPVILMTGEPSLDTAMRAIEHGVLRYLTKPFDGAELVKLVEFAIRQNPRGVALAGSGEAELNDNFESALVSLEMAFQPIICWSARGTVGYEALVRTTEPSFPHPGVLFKAAERLGRLPELGGVIRAKVASKAVAAPNGTTLFVNLHPSDLSDDDLFSPKAPLSRIAESVILEMPEGAPLHDDAEVAHQVSRLRKLGYRIALDDMGAGYAGLASFATLEPDVVKVDISLVRGVDFEPTKQKLVRSVVALCRELGKTVIAEGVETHSERQALVNQGCDLFQGYLFAKPGFQFAEVRW